MTETIGATWIITDRNGREIGYCEDTFEHACDLRDCIGGVDVVDSGEYEDPDEEEAD